MIELDQPNRAARRHAAKSRPCLRGYLRLAGFALAVRISYMAIFLRHYVPQSDALQYHLLAASVADGRGLRTSFPFWYSHQTAFRPPLFPLMLGSLYRVAGIRLLAGMLLNVALGTIVVVLAAVLATDIAGPTAGFSAGVAVALMPSLIANDVVPLTESLSLALILATAILLTRKQDVVAASCCGLLMLTRPSAQGFAVLLGVWVLVRLGAARAVRFSLIVLLIILPWMIRNDIEVGTPQLVTSNGFNLAAMYSDVATARNTFVDPFLDSAFSQVRSHNQTERALDGELRSRSISDITKHPSRVSTVVWRNARFWFEIVPSGNKTAEQLDGRNIGFRTTTLPIFYVVSVVGIAGLVLSRRRTGSALLLLTAVYFTVVSLLTVAPPRLRAPFDLACCIGVGVVASRIRGSRLGNRSTIAAVRDRSRVPASGLRVWSHNGALLVGIAATLLAGVAVRAHAQGAARASAREVVVKETRNVDKLAAAYPIDASEGSLPYTGHALDGVATLAGRLLELSPRLGGRVSAEAYSAATQLKAAHDDFAALALLDLSAEAHRNGVTVASLRAPYETRRRLDPSLPKWPELIAGTTIHDARATLARLEAQLS